MDIQPAPLAPVAGGSLTLWICLAVALAVVVVGVYVLSSRR